MIRFMMERAPTREGIPRESGDDPVGDIDGGDLGEYSPRERG